MKDDANPKKAGDISTWSANIMQYKSIRHDIPITKIVYIDEELPVRI